MASELAPLLDRYLFFCASEIITVARATTPSLTNGLISPRMNGRREATAECASRSAQLDLSERSALEESGLSTLVGVID